MGEFSLDMTLGSQKKNFIVRGANKNIILHLFTTIYKILLIGKEQNKSSGKMNTQPNYCTGGDFEECLEKQ